MSTAEGAFDILVVGFDQALSDHVTALLAPLRPKYLKNSTDVEGFLEGFELSAGTPVIVSSSIEGMTHFEIAQALSSCFTGIILVFVTQDRTKFEIQNLKKNGFSDSFLLPLDAKMMADCFEGMKLKKMGGGARKYKAVKLVDIQAEQKIPFEVRAYMPLNKKYAVLTGSGKLSDKKLNTLKTKGVNSLFISTDQIDKFYEFAADQLINLGHTSNDAVSQTEKAERMQNTVRSLFRSILDSGGATSDFEVGRDLMDQSKKIVESYVQKKTGFSLHDKLREVVGEGQDSYSHAQVVSTIACLLSMSTGVGQPEDLAIAGLFHDIGVEGIFADISIFDIDKLNPQEKEAYIRHPKASLNLLKDRRITVTPIISEIIEKHHERIDGKGFPAQLPEHKIPPEAHILAYADAFEHLSRPQEGKAMLQPQEIHDIIQQKLGISVDLLGKIRKNLIAA